MSIQYEFQASDAFFVTAFERHWKQRSIDKYITTVIRVGVTLLLLGAAATALQGAWGLTLSSICLSAIILSRRLLNRLVLLRNVRKSPYYNEASKTSLSSDGLLEECASSNSSTSWQAFTKAVQFQDGFLLYRGPNIFNWLPNAALVEGSKLEQAESLIRKYVSDYRQIG